MKNLKKVLTLMLVLSLFPAILSVSFGENLSSSKNDLVSNEIIELTESFLTEKWYFENAADSVALNRSIIDFEENQNKMNFLFEYSKFQHDFRAELYIEKSLEKINVNIEYTINIVSKASQVIVVSAQQFAKWNYIDSLDHNSAEEINYTLSFKKLNNK